MVSSLASQCEQPFDCIGCSPSPIMNLAYSLTTKVKGATRLFFRTEAPFQEEEAAWRLRAILLSQSPKIKEYLDTSKAVYSAEGQVLCRLFLEHIYGGKLQRITTKETNRLKLKIHPDKNNYAEATEMFQLHQQLWDGVKSESYNMAWLHYTLYGWWYLRRIRAGTQLDLAV